MESDFISVGEWRYQYQGKLTNIFDGDGDRIATFYERLDERAVRAFKTGWEMAWKRGVEAGRESKTIQIRQMLGL